MKKFVVVTKGGSVETKTVNEFSFETLYKKCRFRSSKGFQKRHTWKWKNGFISVFARDHGRAGGENKYDLPPPVDAALFFGMLGLVYHKNEEPKDDEVLDLDDSEWKSCYEKLFGGFEDLGEEEEEEEEEIEDIPEEYKTKQGYSKEDGFIVDDNEPLFVEDEDSEEEWKEDQDSEKTSDDEEDEDEDEEAAYGHDSTDEEGDDGEGDDDDEEDEDEDDDEDLDKEDDDSELGEEDYNYK